MDAAFKRPHGLIGRFGIVKLWPEIQTAEDECIARLKLAAEQIGLECIEILADGRLRADPLRYVSPALVDFVIHLHYDTPKCYDAFSFVALWNPLRFYHEWGYQRCSRNLTTHDDFISCSSSAADHHVERMIRGIPTHLPASFKLYHSTPGLTHSPGLGSGKLFYAGINWEAINGGKSRHGEVLKRLDETGQLLIYGPEIFQGFRVWAGYRSYVREIPFDGVSMMDEIAKAGIALVLSSPAHKESALMSNRLFESLAAGALIICDENPFAQRFFGDSLLYIDGRDSVERITADILAHLAWARSHPEAALDKIRRAQTLFKEHFTLVGSLCTLYLGLEERKSSLARRRNPKLETSFAVRAVFLMPSYNEEVLRRHLDSIQRQTYGDLDAVLAIDALDWHLHGDRIKAVLATAGPRISLTQFSFFGDAREPRSRVRRPLGEVLMHVLADCGDASALLLIAPNESMHSDHVSNLAGALKRAPEANCAATAALLFRGDEPIHGVNELLDFGHVDAAGPTGYGRFIFRLAGLRPDLQIALPYLDGRPLAAMIPDSGIAQQLAASIRIDITHDFPERTWNEAAETEILRAYNPGVLRFFTGFGPPASHAPHVPSPVSIAHLVRKLFNRVWVREQLQAIRKQGIRARLRLLKSKLGW